MASAAANEKTDAPYEHDVESTARSVSLEKDVATGLVGEHARDIDPEDEARVLRKIDWFLIPAMIVGMSNMHLCSYTVFPSPHTRLVGRKRMKTQLTHDR
jgi:hypothetical protein